MDRFRKDNKHVEPDLSHGPKVTKKQVQDAIKALPDIHDSKTPEQRAEIVARRAKNAEIWRKVMTGEMTVRETNPTLYDALKKTFDESAKAKEEEK